MSNLTNSTSHFSVTEKVQYALKTALFRTMQTAFGDSGSSEVAAPPRIFPKDIMQTNLVEIGKGDIDDDGYFVSRAMGAGYSWNGTNTLAPLEAAELIVAKYRIIDPTTNIITSIRVETLAGDFSGKTQTEIDSMPPSGETYPKKNWFFRGHYTGANDSAKFSNANSAYDGLQLAWDKATPNTTPTEADIVPHLKYYLQVQTNHTGESDVNSSDNHTYIHDKMKGLIGLESNFTSTISVNRGEGGNCTNLNTTGTAAGEYWFTQATSGTLAFYGVGTSGQGGSVGNSLVNANDSLSNLSTTKFPMISYVRYTGETGFGAGTGGGGGSVTLASADSNVSTMIGGTAQTMTTTSFNFDGNVGIGNSSPEYLLDLADITYANGGGYPPAEFIRFGTANISPNSSGGLIWKTTYGGSYTKISAKIEAICEADYFRQGLAFFTGNETYTTDATERMRIDMDGNVGIGTTSPLAKLQIDMGYTGTNGNPTANNAIDSNTDGLFITKQSSSYPSSGSKWGIRLGVLHNSGNSYIQAGNQTANVNYSILLNPNGGNVGIGTTSPSNAELHIANSGRIRFGTKSHLGDHRSGNTTGHVYNDTYGLYWSNAHESNAQSIGAKIIGINRLGTSAQYNITHVDLAFSLVNEYGGSTGVYDATTELMRLKATNDGGRVGIGTTSPHAKLQISGTSTNPSTSTQSSTSSQGILRLQGTGGIFMDFGFQSSSPYAGWIQTHNGSTDGTGDDLLLQPVSGNVGIGTTSPSYKLDVAGDVNFTGTLYKNGVLANADWCCEVEWNTGNAGGTRQVRVNGVQLSTGTNSICAIYLNKNGTYKGISSGYYLYPGNNTNKGHWNSLADEINNQDNGTVVILVSADWICPIATGGSAETLFKSIGSYEATRNVLPNDRVGFICCFIKGNYGCIEKCGDDSTVHNGKVFFTYYNLLNITNGLYNYSTTESPDIQGTNPFFGDVRACHGQLHMGYNLGGTALVGFQSLGTTSSSLYTRGFEFMNAGDESMMTIFHNGTSYTAPRVGIGTRNPAAYYSGTGTGGTFTGFDTILAINGGAPGQTNGSPCVLFQCDDYHTASIYAEHTGNGNTYMGFSTTTGTAAPVERMRIDKDGNVGIGTTTPDVKLDVNGQAKFASIGLAGTNYLSFCNAKVYDWTDTTNYWNQSTSSNILLDFAGGPYFFIGFFRADGVNYHNQHIGNWITLGKGIGAGSWRTKYNHYETIAEKNNGTSVVLSWDGDYWKLTTSGSASGNQNWHIRIIMIDGSLERRRSWGTWYTMSGYTT